MPYKLIEPGKRGPCWYVRGSDGQGEYEYSTGEDNRRAAEKWVTEVFLPDRAGRCVPGRGEDIGFAGAAQAYMAFKGLTPDTGDGKLITEIAAHFGDAHCRSITHAQLVEAANTLRAGWSHGTKNRKVITPGASVLHYAADQEWCDYRRLPKFAESRVSNRKPATDGDMAALFAHIEDPAETMAPQWRGTDPNLAHKRLLLAVLYELGLRLGDTLAIEWPQIDLQKGQITVRIAKTDRVATLELSAVLVSLLANLPLREGFLFPWRTSRGVYAWLDRVRARAGVHYTPHLSRHAMATAAGEKRIPDGEAAKLGAWADPRSLHRYQHVRPQPIPGRDAGFLMAGQRRGQGR